MASTHLFFLSILSTIFVVQWVSAQESSEPGYNLKKGPVFYEAFYYPEKQNAEIQKPVYQDKAELYRDTIPERSFQVPLELDEYPSNSDAPGKYFGQIPLRNYRSTYLSDFKQKALLSNKPGYLKHLESTKNLPNFGTPELLNDIRSGDYPLQIQYPFREYNQPKYSPEYNLGDFRKFSASPETIYMDNINTGSFEPKANYNFARNKENWNLERDFEDHSNFQGSFEKPINHERRTFIELSSPSMTNDIRRGFEYLNLPIKVNIPVERGSVTEKLARNDQRVNLNGNLNEGSIMEMEGKQNFEYDRLRGVPDSMVENIFEPRPQVIRYVFSNPRKNDFERLEKTREEKSNLINEEVQNQADSGAKGEVGIASIKVSEVPRHKIRHHHGERPKRNYSRQQPLEGVH